MGLDIHAVCERLIARFDLKVIGKDDPATAIDVEDLKVNTGILAHIGIMYAVNIEYGFWRQLGECVQFVLGIAPLPGTRNGWMFRWRVSDHHLPPALGADDPEISDTGFMILAWEHVDRLEEMIAAALAQCGGTINLRRLHATPSPAPPTTPPDAGPLPTPWYRQPVADITTDQTTDQTTTSVLLISTSERDKTNDRIAVLSYVPRLYAEAGDCYGPDIQAKLRAAAPAFCDMLLWSSDANGNMAPTFVLPNAKHIYDHLLWWSGNVPAQWFSLVAVDIPAGYIVTLWPDVMKFRDRLKFDPVDLISSSAGVRDLADAKLKVFTVPLRFIGPHSSNWDAAKSRLGATTGVGFLDTSKFDLQNASNTDFSTVLWIEDIPVATDENLKKFVRHGDDITCVIYDIDM